MRRLQPLAKARARYPGLAAAWALLAGAIPTIALADATIPAPGKSPPPSTGTAQVKPQTKKNPCDLGADPSLKPVGIPRREHPMLRGGVGRAHPVNGSPFTLALHPHGPEEPCQLTEIDKEVA